MTDQKIIPDYHLDLMGETCPYVAIATLDAMAQLKSGEILEVVTSCSQSINNVPPDAINHGYQVLEVATEGSNIRYLIRR
jgi:TusA-related sulfurtransferase